MTRVSDRTFQSRQESTFSADSLSVLRCSYSSLSYGVRTAIYFTVFVQLSVLLCSYSFPVYGVRTALSYGVRTALPYGVRTAVCLTVFVQISACLTVFVQVSVLRCSYSSLCYCVRTVLCVTVFVQPRVQSSASAFVRTFTIPSTVWPHENPAHTDRNGWCCSLKPLYLTVPR